MRTFILEWKPSISSYRMEDFNNDLAYIEYGEFNWRVHDWRQARSGDNFYMIKCSEGSTGIVMKGFFTSDPYEADDWSGRNREVHYMNFRPTFMIHPDKCPMLSTSELEMAMPGFQWNGGHSGKHLPEEIADILLCVSQPEGVSLQDHAANVVSSGSDTANKVLRNHLVILLSEGDEHADNALEGEVRQALALLER